MYASWSLLSAPFTRITRVYNREPPPFESSHPREVLTSVMQTPVLYVILLLVTVCGQDCPTLNGISPASRQAIVDKHNAYRSSNALGNEIDGSTGQNAPKAKNMYKLSYDCELEALAQAWASGCQFEHSPNYGEVGENIYSDMSPQSNASVLDALDLWWSELRNIGVGAYSPDFNNSKALNVRVENYVQMAWANTTKVGCGNAMCTSPNMYFVVCNYRLPGNMLNEKIYEFGDPCQQDSDCTVTNALCSASEGLCYLRGLRSLKLAGI
uniref:SCP domain-containing protein n=1 Tax=Steinernema glaseri TaxID=37863 RepID=A0A1I8AL15_9BILA